MFFISIEIVIRNYDGVCVHVRACACVRVRACVCMCVCVDRGLCSCRCWYVHVLLVSVAHVLHYRCMVLQLQPNWKIID